VASPRRCPASPPGYDPAEALAELPRDVPLDIEIGVLQERNRHENDVARVDVGPEDPLAEAQIGCRRGRVFGDPAALHRRLVRGRHRDLSAVRGRHHLGDLPGAPEHGDGFDDPVRKRVRDEVTAGRAGNGRLRARLGFVVRLVARAEEAGVGGVEFVSAEPEVTVEHAAVLRGPRLALVPRRAGEEPIVAAHLAELALALGVLIDLANLGVEAVDRLAERFVLGRFVAVHGAAGVAGGAEKLLHPRPRLPLVVLDFADRPHGIPPRD
jgi:hypothetical protein